MNLIELIGIQAQRKLHGRTEFQGLQISIENRKGSVRSGTDNGGKSWSVTMQHPYGYIRNTLGVDGDHVDCFIGGNPNSRMAYVVHARKSGNSKTYDEDKVMLGFSSAAEAKAAFLANYSDKRFYGGMDTIPMEEFKSKVLQTKNKPQKLVRSKLEEAMEKEKLAAMGEPSTYGGGMGHLDPVPSFHPPSLKKPQRVPADNPGEKDNRFLDVTKRNSKDTQKFRNRLTKQHTTLGGIPQNTAVNTHTSWVPFVSN